MKVCRAAVRPRLLVGQQTTWLVSVDRYLISHVEFDLFWIKWEIALVIKVIESIMGWCARFSSNSASLQYSNSLSVYHTTLKAASFLSIQT